MTENLEDVLKSLLNKLSAVRVTLTDQEQSLLDQLILGSPEETAAQSIHAMKPVATKPVATSPDEAMAQSIHATKPVATKPLATSPNEVVANRLLVLSEEEQSDTDEVSAQTIPVNLLDKAGFYNPVWVKIMYDPEM
jgi:hypothetical protein